MRVAEGRRVRVLLLGATGFIGSAVLARLREAGHEVRAVARPGGARLPAPGLDWAAVDIARATDPADWAPHLDGVETVVNCAGVFQDSARDSTGGVHAAGPGALYEACVAAGLRRVILVSAVGVDRETPSGFSLSKAAGEARLVMQDLDWVILRPSVVLGRDAYGSGALFRGFAALPFLPVMPGAGPLQPVRVEDVAETVVRLLEPGGPSRVALEVVGPERMPMGEVVQRYRAWLGWKPAREMRPPDWALPAAYRLGDVAGWLGWRPSIRSNAGLEMARGAIGDPEAWTAATGIRPRPLGEALAREPAPVQERWFARLYFLRPLALSVLVLYWILTGLVSLGPGWDRGIDLLDGTILGPLARESVVAGALADIAVGIGIAFRRTCRLALWGALGVSAFYALTGTIVRPDLWVDPLGPMLKIAPIMVLIGVALAILDDR